MQETLTPEALVAIEKVTKLLTLARNAGANEHEAQNALDMAHKILEQHNLDMALVERKVGDSSAPHAKRDDRSSGGGLYKWQRDLWKATADLNFCVYSAIKGLTKGSKYENRLIGSPVNVLATRLMAEYLQDTIEKMAAQWAKDQGYSSRFVSEAIQYREGMASRIGDRLHDLQWERLQAAKREKTEREAAARHPSAAATGTALVLTDVKQSEDDLNNDYLKGYELGTTARQRAERDARIAAAQYRRKLWKEDRLAYLAEFKDDTADQDYQQRQDKYEADYAAYLRGEDTETYGKVKKARPSKARGYVYRETAEDRRRNSDAYREGARAGDSVNLDRQIDENKTRRIK